MSGLVTGGAVDVVQELRGLHQRVLVCAADDDGPEIWGCDHCLDNDGLAWKWPCPTTEILDGATLTEITAGWAAGGPS